jgi:two-component system response regulator DesR
VIASFDPVVAATHQLIVMIVEDSEILRPRWVALLGNIPHLGVTVLATTGLQALACFAEARPDAVVLDLELGDVNGLHLLGRMKRARPTCKVIVLASYVFEAFHQRCQDLGADFFLEKAKDFDRVPDILTAIAFAARPA